MKNILWGLCLLVILGCGKGKSPQALTVQIDEISEKAMAVDLAVAKQIAQKLNRRLELVTLEGQTSGKPKTVDLYFLSKLPAGEQAQILKCSEPFWEEKLVLLQPEASKVASVKELAEKTIACQKDSLANDWLKNLQKNELKSIRIHEEDSPKTAMIVMKEGSASLALTEEKAALALAEAYPGILATGLLDAEQHPVMIQQRVAVPQNGKLTLEEVTAILQSLKEDGSLEKLIALNP